MAFIGDEKPSNRARCLDLYVSSQMFLGRAWGNWVIFFIMTMIFSWLMVALNKPCQCHSCLDALKNQMMVRKELKIV